MQVRADAREDLLGLEWLWQVIDSARAQAFDHIVGFVFRRDKNYWRTPTAVSFLQAPASFEAVDAGHHDIEQDEVGPELFVELQRAFPRATFGELIAFAAKDAAKDAQV